MRRTSAACLPVLQIFLLALAGCASTVPIGRLESGDLLAIRLGVSTPVYQPGQTIKFTVEIENKTTHNLDLSDLHVELQARSGSKVALRQDWSYQWGEPVYLAPEKKLSVPVVPREGVELPLDALGEGPYDMVAVVNERYESPPRRLSIRRPDLRRVIRR